MKNLNKVAEFLKMKGIKVENVSMWDADIDAFEFKLNNETVHATLITRDEEDEFIETPYMEFYFETGVYECESDEEAIEALKKEMEEK